MVEGNVDNDTENVKLYGKVLVSFEQCVVNIVAGNYKIMERNLGRRRILEDFGHNACLCLLLEHLQIAYINSAVGTAVN